MRTVTDDEEGHRGRGRRPHEVANVDPSSTSVASIFSARLGRANIATNATPPKCCRPAMVINAALPLNSAALLKLTVDHMGNTDRNERFLLVFSHKRKNRQSRLLQLAFFPVRTKIFQSLVQPSVDPLLFERNQVGDSIAL